MIENIFGEDLPIFQNGTMCLHIKERKTHRLSRRNFSFYKLKLIKNIVENEGDENDGHYEKKYNYRLTRPQIPFRIGGSIGKKRILYQKYFY